METTRTLADLLDAHMAHGQSLLWSRYTLRTARYHANSADLRRPGRNDQRFDLEYIPNTLH